MPQEKQVQPQKSDAPPEPPQANPPVTVKDLRNLAAKFFLDRNEGNETYGQLIATFTEIHNYPNTLFKKIRAVMETAGLAGKLPEIDDQSQGARYIPIQIALSESEYSLLMDHIAARIEILEKSPAAACHALRRG